MDSLQYEISAHSPLLMPDAIKSMKKISISGQAKKKLDFAPSS